MNESIATSQVTLQENGIIRDGKGIIIGRLVADTNALCEEHYQRGFNAGSRVEREACAKVCEEHGYGWSKQETNNCAAAIRARGEK